MLHLEGAAHLDSALAVGGSSAVGSQLLLCNALATKKRCTMPVTSSGI
jgi:hypothetical protein